MDFDVLEVGRACLERELWPIKPALMAGSKGGGAEAQGQDLSGFSGSFLRLGKEDSLKLAGPLCFPLFCMESGPLKKFIALVMQNRGHLFYCGVPFHALFLHVQLMCLYFPYTVFCVLFSSCFFD